MKKLSIIILMLAYLPMFFLCKDCQIRGVYDSIYGILSTIGISLMFFGEFKESKIKLYVPTAILFSVIGTIFFLDTIFDSFYETYKPILLIIISTILCYVFYLFKSARRQ